VLCLGETDFVIMRPAAHWRWSLVKPNPFFGGLRAPRETPLNIPAMNFDIARLGEAVFDSPVSLRFVSDDRRVLYDSDPRPVEAALAAGQRPASFELGGPRQKIFFDPAQLSCGIVTCGGLCPGLNDVIRSIVFTLSYHYGVSTIWGFRFGYEGLVARYGHEPLPLTPSAIDAIHEDGGTILGSSRGPQDVGEMTDTLQQRGIGILFAVGGDGTLRGALAIAEEIRRRGLPISVIGIPKTIDNDISFVHQSFGFHTAVSQTRTPITGAHWESKGVRNGVGLVKLMGRHSGFIAAYATLANSDVNFCLVPEVPFTLPGFLDALQRRLARRAHAVVVVAEGAGQELLQAEQSRDASGNVKLADVGLFLKEKIARHFQAMNFDVNLKYIDPSYMIRSMRTDAHDAAFCLLLGRHAVHAGMSGRTSMLVGDWRGEFTHVPIAAAVSQRKQIHPDGRLWDSVLAATGQPARM
jgi:6-phosphofructokinase 1